MQLPLTLEDFVFSQSELESPEHLAGLGGDTSIAQHDFPGGTRSHQVFGAFPEPLKWQARFTGATALTRVGLLRAKLGAPKEQILSWGDRVWAGRLVKFSPLAHSQWLLTYECEFWTRLDLSQPGTTAYVSAQTQAAGQSAVLQLRLLSLQNLITGAINGTLNISTLFPLVAAQLLGPVGTLISSATQALLNAGGLITAITGEDQSNVLQASLAVLAVATPLSQAADPTVSSPAADVAAYVQSIRTLIVNSAPAPQWTLPVVNPNLFRLAAQYLGDATRWRDIASLNGMSDPQPVGYFPTLQIPAP